jgi:cation transport regulator ChaB
MMPKTGKGGEPIKSELPDTIRRSPKKAQETFAKAHDSAAEEYGEGERAYRVAYAALKRKWERKGDRWVEKDGTGPSAGLRRQSGWGIRIPRTPVFLPFITALRAVRLPVGW